MSVPQGGGFWSNIEFPSGTDYQDNWSMQSEKSINPFVNSYGVMRSAWNKNPSRKLGRHNMTYGVSQMKLPTCDFIHGCYDSNSLEKVLFVYIEDYIFVLCKW